MSECLPCGAPLGEDGQCTSAPWHTRPPTAAELGAWDYWLETMQQHPDAPWRFMENLTFDDAPSSTHGQVDGDVRGVLLGEPGDPLDSKPVPFVIDERHLDTVVDTGDERQIHDHGGHIEPRKDDLH